MNQQPPKRLSMTDAAIYVAREHGLFVSRQTMYNWAQVGKRGLKLHTTKKAGRLLTTERAVDDFVESVH